MFGLILVVGCWSTESVFFADCPRGPALCLRAEVEGGAPYCGRDFDGGSRPPSSEFFDCVRPLRDTTAVLGPTMLLRENLEIVLGDTWG